MGRDRAPVDRLDPLRDRLEILKRAREVGTPASVDDADAVVAKLGATLEHVAARQSSRDQTASDAAHLWLYLDAVLGLPVLAPSMRESVKRMLAESEGLVLGEVRHRLTPDSRVRLCRILSLSLCASIRADDMWLPMLLEELQSRLDDLRAHAGGADQEELRMLEECNAELLSAIDDVAINLELALKDDPDPDVADELEGLYDVAYRFLTPERKRAIEARTRALHEESCRDNVLRAVASDDFDEAERHLEEGRSKHTGSTVLAGAQRTLEYCRELDDSLLRFCNAVERGVLTDALDAVDVLLAAYSPGVDPRERSPRLPADGHGALARALPHCWDDLRLTDSEQGLALFKRTAGLLEAESDVVRVDGVRRALELARASLSRALMDLWLVETAEEHDDDRGRLFDEYTTPRHTPVIALQPGHPFKRKLERFRASGIILAHQGKDSLEEKLMPLTKDGVEFACPPLDQIRRETEEEVRKRVLSSVSGEALLRRLRDMEERQSRLSSVEAAIESGRLERADELIAELGPDDPEADPLKRRRVRKQFEVLLSRGEVEEAQQLAIGAEKHEWFERASFLSRLLALHETFDLDTLLILLGSRVIKTELPAEARNALRPKLDGIAELALEEAEKRFRVALREGDQRWVADAFGVLEALRSSGIAPGLEHSMAAWKERLEPLKPLADVWQAVHKNDLRAAESGLAALSAAVEGLEFGVVGARVSLMRLSRSYEHEVASALLLRAEDQGDEVAGLFIDELAEAISANADFALADQFRASEKFHVLDSTHQERIRAVAAIGARRCGELPHDPEVLGVVLPPSLRRLREMDDLEAVARLYVHWGAAAPDAFEECSSDLDTYFSRICSGIQALLKGAEVAPRDYEEGRRQVTYLRNEGDRLVGLLEWQRPVLANRCGSAMVDFAREYPRIRLAADGFLRFYATLDALEAKRDLRSIGDVLRELDQADGLRALPLHTMMRQGLQRMDAERRDLAQCVRDIAETRDAGVFLGLYDRLRQRVKKYHYEVSVDIYGLRCELPGAQEDVGTSALSDYLEKCGSAKTWLDRLEKLERHLRKLDPYEAERWSKNAREHRRSVARFLKQIGREGQEIIVGGVPLREHQVVRARLEQLRSHELYLPWLHVQMTIRQTQHPSWRR